MVSFIGTEELWGHPLLGSPEPRSRSLHTFEASDAGEPEVAEARTARPVNENIILGWETVRLPPTRVRWGNKLRHTPFRSPCTISKVCKNDKPRLMSSNWTCVS